VPHGVATVDRVLPFRGERTVPEPGGMGGRREVPMNIDAAARHAADLLLYQSRVKRLLAKQSG
jgi:hypothetical protein